MKKFISYDPVSRPLRGADSAKHSAQCCFFLFSLRCSPGGSVECIHSCTHPAPKSILNTLFFTQVGIYMQPK